MSRTLFLRITMHFNAKVRANSTLALANRKTIYTASKFSYRNFFYRNVRVEVNPVFAYDRINRAQEKEDALYTHTHIHTVIPRLTSDSANEFFG